MSLVSKWIMTFLVLAFLIGLARNAKGAVGIIGAGQKFGVGMGGVLSGQAGKNTGA